MTKPWWIWRWVGGGGNAVSTEVAPTKKAALAHARKLGEGCTRPLMVAMATMQRATWAEYEAFDHELYMMWC